MDFFFLGTPRGGRGFRFTAGWNAGVWGRVEYLLFLHFSSLFFAFLILFFSFLLLFFAFLILFLYFSSLFLYFQIQRKGEEKEKKRKRKAKKSRRKAGEKKSAAPLYTLSPPISSRSTVIIVYVCFRRSVIPLHEFIERLNEISK